MSSNRKDRHHTEITASIQQLVLSQKSELKTAVVIPALKVPLPVNFYPNYMGVIL